MKHGIITSACVLLWVLAQAVTAGMTHVDLPQSVADAFGSKCLNGQAPSYEIRTNSSSAKWILFLEGGGWCNGATANATIDACAGRAGFKPLSAFGSSTEPKAGFLPKGGEDFGGVLGEDAGANPDFYSWNAVFIHYCDGASFGSSRPDPIPVQTQDGKPAQMWMRGRNNFDGVIQDLQTRYGMSNATDIILSGGSAGGLAVFYNIDHLADKLGPGVRLTGFPDAGFFLDEVNVADNQHTYRNIFIGADPVWNVTGSGGTNLACLQFYKGTGDRYVVVVLFALNCLPSTVCPQTDTEGTGDSWKCLMAQYLVPHIRTPLFVMNSAYDAYQLPNIAGISCQASTASHPCNDSEAQAYGAKFKAAVQVVVDASPRNGVFVDSCFVHEQNVNYCSGQGIPNCVGWTPSESGSVKWNYTTAVGGFTPQQAFSAYYSGERVVHLVDESRLQQNPSCVFNQQSVTVLVL